MSTTCQYHEHRFAVCAAPATHGLSFDTLTGRCLGYVLAENERTTVFCLTHAGVVSQGLQQRWQAAKEARAHQPPPRHSAASRTRPARDAAE